MELSIGDLFGGRFRIDGETAGIYAAQDQLVGRRVALEFMGEGSAADPTTAGAFTRQARAAKGVDHPGVIAVLDAGVSMGTPWIATELREGETLHARMERGSLGADEAIDIGIGVLEALEAAHRQGVVHLALSPSDIVLGPDGKASIRGFGKGALTPGQLASFHVAPEQASGDGSAGPAADLYSVCAILYEAISGTLPYDVTGFGELVEAMKASDPQPLQERRQDVPARLASVIDQGLAVDPAQRHADVRGLIDGLRGLAGTMQQAPVIPPTMALDSDVPQAAVGAPGAFSAPADAPNIAQSAQVIRPTAKKASGIGVGAVIGILVGGCALLYGLVVIAGMIAGFYFVSASTADYEAIPTYEPVPAVPYEPTVSLSSLAPMPGASAERFRIDADGAPALGGTQPLVTIVTFGDFECPFCSRIDPTMDRIRATYGDRVRYVWRHNPLSFHQNAMPAAQAAHEAYVQGGSVRFWAMHDQLFANQRELDRASLERYAATAGMDVAQLRAALDTDRHRARIEADQAITTRAGALGTPAFFINGRKLMGAQPYDRFAEIIDEEIALANELMLRGVSGGSLYAAFQRDARRAGVGGGLGAGR